MNLPDPGLLLAGEEVAHGQGFLHPACAGAQQLALLPENGLHL